MVDKRPHTATFKWQHGYTYLNGKISGGTTLTMIIPCRLEKAGINEVITQDGRKIEASYKIFCDNPDDFLNVDESTLSCEISGKKYKVLHVEKKQTHVRVWI